MKHLPLPGNPILLPLFLHLQVCSLEQKLRKAQETVAGQYMGSLNAAGSCEGLEQHGVQEKSVLDTTPPVPPPFLLQVKV